MITIQVSLSKLSEQLTLLFFCGASAEILHTYEYINAGGGKMGVFVCHQVSDKLSEHMHKNCHPNRSSHYMTNWAKTEIEWINSQLIFNGGIKTFDDPLFPFATVTLRRTGLQTGSHQSMACLWLQRASFFQTKIYQWNACLWTGLYFVDWY